MSARGVIATVQVPNTGGFDRGNDPLDKFFQTQNAFYLLYGVYQD